MPSAESSRRVETEKTHSVRAEVEENEKDIREAIRHALKEQKQQREKSKTTTTISKSSGQDNTELKPLFGGSRRPWKAPSSWWRSETSTLPPWMVAVLVVIICGCADFAQPSSRENHLLVPEYLPRNTSVAALGHEPFVRTSEKKLVKKVAVGSQGFPAATFHTAFREYLEGRRTREDAVDTFNVYVGTRGGLTEHQLLDWLKFCGEPPVDEAGDLDETFIEIDISHREFVSFDDLEHEMRQREKDLGVKGCTK